MTRYIEQMVLPPEPRPTEGWYWIQHRHGHFEAMQWFEGAWLRAGEAGECWPWEIHADGWVYHSKIEEPAA